MQDRRGIDRFSRIPIYYAAISYLWILTSDYVLGHLGLESALAWMGATVKGLLFVTVTTLYLHYLIQAAARRERAQAERARAVFETAADGILVLTPGGTIRACNGAALRMTGFPEPGLVGRDVGTLLPSASDPSWQDLAARSGVTGEFETLRADGTTFPAQWRLSTARIQDEPFLIALLQDLSERKALERQLLQAQKMESVGRLAAGVTHDLNNLLTVALGRTESLREQVPPSSPAFADVLAVERAARRAADLSRNLLAFSRAPLLGRRAVDLGRVLEGMKPMLQGLVGESIELEVIPPGRPCRVLAEETRLEQVLLNLAVNARDAMAQGGRLVVEAVLPEQVPPGESGVLSGPCAKLIVRDTGQGMDAQTLNRIFDPFFTTKPPGEGTGLGLSVVYGLMEQFGGTIQVSSQPGRGTEFRVYVPEAAGPEPAPDPGQESAPAPASPPGRPRKSQANILLVEDDAELRDLARRLLQRGGHRVVEAGAAPEALELETAEFDLLVTDLGLPGMDGAELARRLAERHPGLPVVLMSGYAGGPAAHAGSLPKGTALLEKPFRGQQLMELVEEALRGPAGG